MACPGTSWPTWKGTTPYTARSPSRVKVGADDTTLGLAGNTLASELKRLLMTTTPAPGPSAPADNKTTLRLSRLLKRPVADRSGESIGRLADVIVRLRGSDYPLVTGLVAAVGGREIFVPIDQVSSFDGEPMRLSSARLEPAALRTPRRRSAAQARRTRPPVHRRGERPPGPRGRPRAGQGRRGVGPGRGGHPAPPAAAVRAARPGPVRTTPPSSVTGTTSSGSSGTRAVRCCAGRSAASAG